MSTHSTKTNETKSSKRCPRPDYDLIKSLDDDWVERGPKKTKHGASRLCVTELNPYGTMHVVGNQQICDENTMQGDRKYSRLAKIHNENSNKVLDIKFRGTEYEGDKNLKAITRSIPCFSRSDACRASHDKISYESNKDLEFNLKNWRNSKSEKRASKYKWSYGRNDNEDNECLQKLPRCKHYPIYVNEDIFDPSMTGNRDTNVDDIKQPSTSNTLLNDEIKALDDDFWLKGIGLNTKEVKMYAERYPNTFKKYPPNVIGASRMCITSSNPYGFLKRKNGKYHCASYRFVENKPRIHLLLKNAENSKHKKDEILLAWMRSIPCFSRTDACRVRGNKISFKNNRNLEFEFSKSMHKDEQTACLKKIKYCSTRKRKHS